MPYELRGESESELVLWRWSSPRASSVCTGRCCPQLSFEIWLVGPLFSGVDAFDLVRAAGWRSLHPLLVRGARMLLLDAALLVW